MNNRHRRVAKLKKQELNAAKAKFEKEYGISAEKAMIAVDFLAKNLDGFIGSVREAFGRVIGDIGNVLVSLGKQLQRNTEDKE